MMTKQLPLQACVGLQLALSGALSAQPGTLDPDFNGAGYVVTPVNNGDNAQKILVQPDQKVLTVGMSFDATFTSRAQVFRYLPDGTLDTDFGTDGGFTYTLDFEANLYSAALTSEGK
ncbi:MAG: delta-60 repeat domain-containing protein, partial [Flavobacteriales bacterium]